MVLEFRRDPSKSADVSFATDRSARPLVFEADKNKLDACPFDPGVEHITPKTEFALPSENDWKVRCFENAFPFVKLDSKTAFGKHEVIVETNNHPELFAQFSPEQLLLVFQAYANRTEALRAIPGVKCVYLFKNHGKTGGASIDHEHAQIVALPFVPPMIASELNYYKRYHGEHHACWYCDLLDSKKMNNQAGNIAFENDSFVALCPSFARFPLETWILPKTHARDMLEFSPKQAVDFMQILQKLVKKQTALYPDYVIAFHQAPKGEDFHFHAEFYPRRNYWAGMELGAGIAVNSRSELDALAALKD